MIPPTPQQAKAIDAIRRLTVDGSPPTYEQLQTDLGLSSRGRVHYLLNRMKDRGLVTFEYGRARSLRIIEAAEQIDLEAMTGPQLVRLRERIEATLINRWKS